MTHDPRVLAGIAQVCHEANRAYARSIGDHSHAPWEMADEPQKASAIAGVQYALDNPAATPEEQHNAWLAQKRRDGWKYGEVKDAERKEHPCYVPYSELPPAQRVKDILFRAIVTALRPL